MSQSSISSMRPFNNDHMPQFAQLQARVQAAQARQASLDAGTSAAVGLQTAMPKPAQLDDSQAQSALASVQQATNISSVHSGLDPQRVARLLGLLD